jgi:glutathione S-transferase
VALHQPVPSGLLQDLQRLQTLWTEGLQRFGGPFLAGKNFSAVDAFFCPVAFRVHRHGSKSEKKKDKKTKKSKDETSEPSSE